MKATRESAILRCGIREIITSNEPRTGMIFSVYGKNQAHRFSSIQEAVGLVSDSFQLLRGNENSTRSEVASLPKIRGCPGVPVHGGIPIVFISIYGVVTQFVNVSFLCVPVHEDTTKNPRWPTD